jgi:hypothetical protein
MSVAAGWALALLGLVAAAGCAAAVYMTPTSVDEYAAVRVRIYHAAGRCRVEVVTATETIQTLPTRCARVPHRVAATP